MACPFPRDKRAIVYQRAKGVLDKRPFGTQYDVYASRYEWMHHSIAPKRAAADAFRILIGGADCQQPYSASVFNISAMSFGSLSANAIRALNKGAKMGGFARDTGEGGLSPYHREHDGDIIWEIGSGYFGCRNRDDTFSPDAFARVAESPQVKMVELKLSQHAKPGHGGVLPAAWNAAVLVVALGGNWFAPGDAATRVTRADFRDTSTNGCQPWGGDIMPTSSTQRRKGKPAFAILQVLALGLTASSPTAAQPTLDGQRVLVIAHRGASGYLPEHTLEAYALAIEMGADFIEPDLVASKDGVLIARHEPMLSATTDVAERPENASRRVTRKVDGIPVTDWFASDFTLEELRRLRAKQAMAERDQSMNGKFLIPTLQEVIDLAKSKSVGSGGVIGVYPEMKHPTFHAEIGMRLEDRLLDVLNAASWTEKSSPVIVQSFEVAGLKYLRSKTRVRLVQLIDADDVDKNGNLVPNLSLDWPAMISRLPRIAEPSRTWSRRLVWPRSRHMPTASARGSAISSLPSKLMPMETARPTISTATAIRSTNAIGSCWPRATWSRMPTTSDCSFTPGRSAMNPGGWPRISRVTRCWNTKCSMRSASTACSATSPMRR